MNQPDFLKLLDKYLEGTATDEEKDLLNLYYSSFQQSDKWNEEALGKSELTETHVEQRIQSAIAALHVKRIPLLRQAWLRAAAIFILLAGTTLWWWSKPEKEKVVATINQQISPESAAAKLTLTTGDGQVIFADQAPDGILLQRDGVVVEKQKELIIYRLAKASHGQNNSLHTIATATGAQYRVVLPDGSEVWLNTASEISFSPCFEKKERQVALSGEAYFEVAKEPSRPFRVYTGKPANGVAYKGVIEVLGTHFNVNAYSDERTVKTTLLEGSVKISAAKSTGGMQVSRVLKPNQEAEISDASRIDINATDASASILWKSNLFNFEEADVGTIMRQISRWYNVEIIYNGPVSAKKFSGKISRSTDISVLLNILKQSGIQLRMQHRKIIVMP